MSIPGPRTRYEWQPFSVAGIPVTFSAWFLLAVWAVLARSGTLGSGVLHLVALTASVLAHELGHGLAAKHYRLEPKILLHGFGGWCEHQRAHYRDDALRVTVAGPAAGLVFGLVAWGIRSALVRPDVWVDQLLWDLTWMGLVWSAVNLLPVLPLDGGSILLNLLERRRSIADPTRTAHQVGLAVAVGSVPIALHLGAWPAAVLFAMLAWSNAAALRWVPSFSGSPAVSGYSSRRGRRVARPAWRPTPAVGVLLLAVAVAAILRAVADNLLVAWGWMSIEPGTVPPDIWRVLTYAVVPAGRPLTLVGVMLALWFTGPAVELRVGARGFAALVFVATVLAGVAGVVCQRVLAPQAVLAGPVPLAVAVFAAWAWVERSAMIGTAAGGPEIRPLFLLAVGLAVDLGVRWSTGDSLAAAADLVAAATGLLFVRQLGASGSTWKQLSWEWRLWNPPPVPIDELSPRQTRGPPPPRP